MTDEQRNLCVAALMRQREAHKLAANGKVYDAVLFVCMNDIAAIEPIIDEITSKSLDGRCGVDGQ